jgi:hypothetical protein
MGFEWDVYMKTLLTAIASLFLAVLLPGFASMFRLMTSQKATGFTAVSGGLLERALSPWFWVSYLLSLSMFYVTAGLENRILRVFFFWIPSIVICVAGFGFWALFLYVMTRARTAG